MQFFSPNFSIRGPREYQLSFQRKVALPSSISTLILFLTNSLNFKILFQFQILELLTLVSQNLLFLILLFIIQSIQRKLLVGWQMSQVCFMRAALFNSLWLRILRPQFLGLHISFQTILAFLLVRPISSQKNALKIDLISLITFEGSKKREAQYIWMLNNMDLISIRWPTYDRNLLFQDKILPSVLFTKCLQSLYVRLGKREMGKE